MKTFLIPLAALGAAVAPVAAPAQTVGIANYYESRECHPSAYQRLVGHSVTRVLAGEVQPGPLVRVFGPGAILTDDFNPNRVNIVADDGVTVSRVYCG